MISQITDVGARLTSTVISLSSKENKYFFSDKYNLHRGKPVDEFDRTCQDWYRCNKCVKMDLSDCGEARNR